MVQYEFDVEGMTCRGCENIIEQALADIDCVSEVAADHAAGRVEVTADEGMREELVQQIESLSYEVAN